MFRFICIAIRDIYRQSFKTILFTSIIATCITALIIVVNLDNSISIGINEKVVNSIDNRLIQVEVKNSERRNYNEYLRYLKSNGNIEDAFRYTIPILSQVKGDLTLSKGAYSLVSGNEKYFPEVITGSSIKASDKNVVIVPKKLYFTDWNNKQVEPVLGESLIGKNIEFEYKNEKTGNRDSYQCEVIGVYENDLSDNIIKIYIPFNDMERICEDIGQYSSNENYFFNVIVKNEKSVEFVINELSKKNNFKVYSLKEYNNSMYSNYETIEKVSKYSVILICIFLAGILYICVSNIAINNNKQIALYKSLGYRNIHIFKIVFIEGGIISLIGYIEAIIISSLIDEFIVSPILLENLGVNLIKLNLSYVGSFFMIIIIIFLVSLFLYLKVKDIYPALLLKES